MRIKLIVGVAVLALLLAACGGSGKPTEFNDTVRDNFTEGCTEGLLGERSIRSVQSVCACTYRSIENNITFEDFETLNEELLEDISVLTNENRENTVLTEVRRRLADCIVDCRTSSSDSCQPFLIEGT